MPKTYVGVSGIQREVKKIVTGVSGVNREVKKGYAGISGVNREVFSGDISSQIKICTMNYKNEFVNIDPINMGQYLYNRVAIHEPTGDIYIDCGGNYHSVHFRFAAVSTPINIKSISYGVTSPPLIARWMSYYNDDGSSTWTGCQVVWYFTGAPNIPLFSVSRNSATAADSYNCADLLGYVRYKNERVRFSDSECTKNATLDYMLTTDFTTAGCDLEVYGTTDQGYSSTSWCQIKIPNKSIVINGQPIDFLQCVRTTN